MQSEFDVTHKYHVSLDKSDHEANKSIPESTLNNVMLEESPKWFQQEMIKV